MANFQKVKLRHVITKIIGGGTPSKNNSDYWNGSLPWASVKDLSDNKYYLDSTQDFITEEGLKNSATNSIKKDTVVLPTRMGLGRVVKTRIDITINQDLKAIIPNEKINNDFLLWSLVNSGNKLQTLGTGSTVSGIRLEELKNIEIDLPDLPTQTLIASVLSAYDDLIENNEKRIKALEEMAQLLYTEWFVKFKFPRNPVETQNLASVQMVDASVQMVDSGTEYGMVPEGWEVVNVGDLLETVKRKGKLKTDEYKIAGLYPIVDQGKDFIAGYTDNEATIYNENLIVFGDHSRCFKYINFSFTCGADGTQLLKTNDSERMPQILLYYSVINAGLQNYNYTRHFKFLKALNILKPDSVTVKSFDKLTSQSYEQIKKLRQQNQNLSKTRDLLIPQLVTGRREVR